MRWQRVVLATFLVASFVFVGIALKSNIVQAEGDNNFPGLENAANDWIVSNKSPDPRLTYLYTGGGTDNGNTTHILRNRTIGRNEGTRLRIYYKRPPQTVRVTISTVACELEANGSFAGRVQVVLGGELKYDQPTRGKKVDEQQQRYHWVLDPNAGPNQRPYVLGYLDTVTVDSDRDDKNSPVCKNFGDKFDINRYVEGCNDPNATGTRCGGVGNNTFSKTGTVGEGTVPWDGSGYGDRFAVGNKLDGRTFETAFSMRPDGKMGYDANTRLYYADLDIDLTAGADASANGSGADPNMMQRITFNVKGEDAFNGSTWMNARMGYRWFGNDEDRAERFFGLQGNGGRTNDFPGWSQKHALPFGPDCDGSDRNGKIILYDPDTGGYGDVFMTVLRRNPENGNVIQLRDEKYTEAGTTNNVAFAYNGTALRSTASGSGSRSSFFIRMEVGFQYMLVVFNPNQKPPKNNYPSSNVYSVYLPTDSMNGLVNCRYDLTPSINNVRPAFSGYGDSLSGTGSIVNTNPEASTGDHNWKISKVVYSSRPSDLSRTGVEDSPLDPCQFAASKPGTQLSCNANVFDGTYPATESHTFNENVGPYDIGTYVCYFTSVRNPTWRPTDDNQRRYSNMLCSVAGIKPKIQAWGYDTKATGRIKTSLSEVNGRRYGSWAEYGLLSNSTNIGMASGNGLLGGAPSGTPQGSWSPLTFANDSTTVGFCGFGCYGGVTMPLVGTQGATTVAGDLNIGSYAQLAAAVGSSKGKLRVNGTVRITGPIVYPDSTNGISGIPKIQIIANDIVIDNVVGQVDPWLIAVGTTGSNGRISTCSEAQQAGNYFIPMQNANLYGGAGGICTNPIKFNSPLIADKVYLYRTHDQQDGAIAAETLNVRADNFLSSYVGGGTTQPVAVTESVRELPPRF